jgi:hypothetical protein
MNGLGARDGQSVRAASVPVSVGDHAGLEARRACGHLTRDGREHAIKLLDALSAPWMLVVVPWTPKQKRRQGRQRQARR